MDRGGEEILIMALGLVTAVRTTAHSTNPLFLSPCKFGHYLERDTVKGMKETEGWKG